MYSVHSHQFTFLEPFCTLFAAFAAAIRSHEAELRPGVKRYVLYYLTLCDVSLYI